MHFKTAYLKLTLFYVLIVMTISIIFSVVIYRISSVEIDRGLGNQTRALREMPHSNNPFIDKLEQIRDTQLEESNNRIKLNLIYFNLLILVLSSVASYFFAKKTLEPIEKAMEAQNRFTADASHELRTPLTAMKTETEVNLRDKNLNLSDAKKLLQSNLEEIDKLEYLSSALLKLAKYDNETKKDFERINLAEVIEFAIEKVDKLANQKSIVISAKLKKVEMLADKPSLIELFVILLDNAIKYSPKGSKVTVETKKTDHHLKVIISDQGIGIKKSDLPYIFNRFYRADISRSKEKVDGYGLGLSITKRIVELHGGTITANSKIGKGSEFTIHL